MAGEQDMAAKGQTRDKGDDWRYCEGWRLKKPWPNTVGFELKTRQDLKRAVCFNVLFEIIKYYSKNVFYVQIHGATFRSVIEAENKKNKNDDYLFLGQYILPYLIVSIEMYL